MKNNYHVVDDELFIYLNRKDGTILETVTDASLLDKLMELNVKWYPKWNHTNNKFYVQATQYLYMENGKPKYRNLYLHKYIMGDVEKDMNVDHINNDSLDNRLSNLRVITGGQNNLNRTGANKNSSTGVRNVRFDKKYNKYSVLLWVDGKNKYFGSFDEDDLDLAAELAELARQKYYGL